MSWIGEILWSVRLFWGRTDTTHVLPSHGSQHGSVWAFSPPRFHSGVPVRIVAEGTLCHIFLVLSESEVWRTKDGRHESIRIHLRHGEIQRSKKGRKKNMQTPLECLVWFAFSHWQITFIWGSAQTQREVGVKCKIVMPSMICMYILHLFLSPWK